MLDAFEADVLRPDLIARVIRGGVAALQPSIGDLEARRAALRTQRNTVEAELERLTAAIAAGGGLEPLVTALKSREAARQAIKADLASLGAASRLDTDQIEREARERPTAWRELLQLEAVGPARQVLKKLLAAPLRVRPYRQDGARGWEVTGRGSLGTLLSGLVAANIVASPICASWNQLRGWLRAVEGLRLAA